MPTDPIYCAQSHYQIVEFWGLESALGDVDFREGILVKSTSTATATATTSLHWKTRARRSREELGPGGMWSRGMKQTKLRSSNSNEKQIEPRLKSICILIEYNRGSLGDWVCMLRARIYLGERTSGGRFRVSWQMLHGHEHVFGVKGLSPYRFFAEASIARSIAFWIMRQCGWGPSNQLWEQSHV